MIYYAYRTCPIVYRFEEANVAEMRDRVSCDNIISQDDFLSPIDLPLFMSVLHILDFLYYTVVPACATDVGLFIIKKLFSSD